MSTERIKLALTIVGGIGLILLPYWAGDLYQLHLASLIGAYWVLIAGLNLVVGYTGQLSIGHVGLLAVGSYAFAIIAGKLGLNPELTMLICGVIGGVVGALLGLPSLRLPGFYFAMATMAFALIVTELSLAQGDLTGGGTGLSVPGFSAPFDSPWGHYWLILGVGAFVTWLTWNVARFMWGRALIAIRDSEVAAASVGIGLFRLKLTVFIFSGVTAGFGGALFSSLQSYITPDTFVFEIGLFFFVCIIIGGRGTILGPFIGTVILTALPELVAPLAKFGAFFYGLTLLIVVLLIPEGFGRLVEVVVEKFGREPHRSHEVKPDLARLGAALKQQEPVGLTTGLAARSAGKHFGGVVALKNVSIDLQPGEVHGLIGPNGSGKTTMLNLLSGYYKPDEGEILIDGTVLTGQSVQRRPRLGVARTFQKPRLLGALSVLDNGMLGAWRDVASGFVATALALPRARREEREIKARAEELIHGVGLGHAIHRRANLLEHAEQRFLEIARALALRPRYLLLDEPAGGLTGAEIGHLGSIIKSIRDAGIGVLLVEHHTDFVFRICGRVTALDRGRLIKHGRPDEVRTDAEVVRIYLGA